MVQKRHRAKSRRLETKFWNRAVIAWIIFILFSSTSLARVWSEMAFAFFSNVLFGGMEPHTSTYGMVHLLAEKGFHVGMFCVLAFLLWQTLAGRAQKTLIILLTGAAVGSCSEFLQSFFPDRDPAVRDVFINIGGTALGVGICILLSRRQRQTPSIRTA